MLDRLEKENAGSFEPIEESLSSTCAQIGRVLRQRSWGKSKGILFLKTPPTPRSFKKDYGWASAPKVRRSVFVVFLAQAQP
jgi:hypothetical protein